jgi:hypothetical protein
LDYLEPVNPDRWLIVIAEQGIGDQVLFLSALNDLAKEHQRTIYLTEPRTQTLISRSFPEILVANPGILERLTELNFEVDGYLPLGSVMGRYRPTVESFAESKRPFITPNKALVKRYRKELEKQAGGQAIVGVSWKGGFWANQVRSKAIEFDDWKPLLSDKGFFVNLQYGDIENEKEICAKENLNLTFIEGIDFREDIESWSALAAACDGIISVSTALVHFAGAMGKRVFVVMPSPQGPWHLGLTETKHLVYPDVHIFRRAPQQTLGDLVSDIAKRVV